MSYRHGEAFPVPHLWCSEGEYVLWARGHDGRDYMATLVGVQGEAGAGEGAHRLPVNAGGSGALLQC